MSNVTRILQAMDAGDPHAASQLLPLVYDELRQLAAQRMAQEQPGQTLDATALVHEAYLRLLPTTESPRERCWEGRAHFFGAAAEAMRRILVENARRKKRLKHGGDRQRVPLHPDLLATPEADEELIDLDAALTSLAAVHPVHARVVELRHFAGLTGEQAADLLGISPSTADRHWVFARAWLRREIQARRSI